MEIWFLSRKILHLSWKVTQSPGLFTLSTSVVSSMTTSLVKAGLQLLGSWVVCVCVKCGEESLASLTTSSN